MAWGSKFFASIASDKRSKKVVANKAPAAKLIIEDKRWRLNSLLKIKTTPIRAIRPTVVVAIIIGKSIVKKIIAYIFKVDKVG